MTVPRITIDVDEAIGVLERIGCALHGDDDSPIGQFCADFVDGGAVRWVATDGHRMFALDAGRHSGSPPPGQVLVPRSVIEFGVRAARNLGTDSLVIDVEDQLWLRLPGLEVPVAHPAADHPMAFPSAAELFDTVPDRAPVVVRLHVAGCIAAVHAVTTFGTAGDLDRPIVLDVDVGAAEIRVRDDDGPEGLAFIAAESLSPVEAVVNPQYLIDLLVAAGTEFVDLHLDQPHHPMRVCTDTGFRGLLMPIEVGPQHVQVQIAEFLGIDPSDQEVAEDGSFVVAIAGGADVTIRPVGEHRDPFARDARVEFSAVVADHVPLTPALVEALNDHNAESDEACRLLWRDDSVVVASRHHAIRLEEDDVVMACNQLRRIVASIGPLVQAVHGDAAAD